MSLASPVINSAQTFFTNIHSDKSTNNNGNLEMDDSSFGVSSEHGESHSSSHEKVIYVYIPFFAESVPAIWALFAIAGLFVVLATVLSAHLIYKHLKYYTQPDHQRYIVRIVFMIPIYAIYSLLSLVLHSYEVYFSLFRDCYEAYVLYMFFCLCVSYGGGDKNLVTHFVSHPPLKLPIPLFCKVKPNERFLQVCRMGMLQYVLIRPTVTLASAILAHFDLYSEGIFAVNNFYPYASLIINLSVTVALYIIVLFYQAAIEELAPYSPLLKFTSIKIVVFFCFWQSVVIAGMVKFGIIGGIDGWDSGEVSAGLNNFLICFEMFGVSILHIYAFPYELYRVRAFSSAPLIHRVEMGSVFKSVINSVSQKDMIKETVHAFKGTKITDGKSDYNGLKNSDYSAFDVDEIEMGEFTSYKDTKDTHKYFTENAAILSQPTSANQPPMISDDDFFSLMNNDYTNIDFTGIDQDALDEMNFDDYDEDVKFTARR